MMHKEAAEVGLSAPVQTSDNVPPSCVARDGQPSCCVPVGRDLLQSGLPCTSPRWRSCRTRSGGWPLLCDWARHPMLGCACPCARATRAKRAITHWRRTLSVANTVVPGWTSSCCPVHTEQTDLPGWRTRRHGKTPVTRCAILDVVSCFAGVLQQLGVDVNV